LRRTSASGRVSDVQR